MGKFFLNYNFATESVYFASGAVHFNTPNSTRIVPPKRQLHKEGMVAGSSYSRNDETSQRKSFKKRILCKYPINCAWTLVHMLFWCRGWHGADIRSIALVWYLKGISENSIFSVYNFWKKMPRIAFTRHFTYFNFQIKAFINIFFSKELMSVRPIYEDSMKSAGLAHLDLNLLPSVLPGKGQASFVCCLTSR